MSWIDTLSFYQHFATIRKFNGVAGQIYEYLAGANRIQH